MALARNKRTRLIRSISLHRGVLLPVATLALLFVILVPLPPWFMDILLSTNITIAAIVLLTVMYVARPLEFSSFPSMLLDPLLNAARPVKRFTLKLKPNTDDVRTLLNWMRRGMLKPLISERVAFANAIAALDQLQAGRSYGKLVVAVS